MVNPPTWLAACGLYCGACYHYRAAFSESRYLLQRAAAQGRSHENLTCQGCRSDKLYIHPGCSQCGIRDCAESRGLLYCGECEEMPCERLLTFQNDGRRHHLEVLGNLWALNEQGPKAWLQAQAAYWTCECGMALSWYDQNCPKCGRARWVERT